MSTNIKISLSILIGAILLCNVDYQTPHYIWHMYWFVIGSLVMYFASIDDYVTAGEHSKKLKEIENLKEHIEYLQGK